MRLKYLLNKKDVDKILITYTIPKINLCMEKFYKAKPIIKIN